MPSASPRSRRALVAALAALAVPAGVAGVARADFFSDHDSQLLSVTGGSAPELGDADTNAIGLSSDGRYALLSSRARNFIDSPPSGQKWSGAELLRKDRVTGALEVVALPFRSRTSDGATASCAGNNETGGISGDGRFVAFSTPLQLTSADTNHDEDVYLRDMTKAASAAGAYTLVSARNGSDTPATYDSPAGPDDCFPGQTGSTLARTAAQAGTVVSNDGTRVVFSTQAGSDLPASSTTDTPGSQLFVRDVAAKTTTLVTRTPGGDPAGTAGDGLATISGDGSTVVWSGDNAAAQVPANEYSPDVEQNGIVTNDLLWRNLAEGVTRRVAPPVDYHDPACTPAELQNTPPSAVNDEMKPESACLTPFLPSSSAADIVGVSLSTDGRTVAFDRAGRRRGVQKFAPSADVWVSDMRAGVSRKAGSREITRAPLGSGSVGVTNVPVLGVALAPDASKLVFASARIDYGSLTNPSPIGTFRSASDPASANLYSVDLGANTLELASRAQDGGQVKRNSGQSEGVLVPALSADGSVAAWSTNATNLFAGDSNGAFDALAVVRKPAQGPPGDPGPGPGPGTSTPPFGGVAPPRVTVPGNPPKPAARASVRVSAKAAKKGVVTLTIKVSGKGKVSVRGTGKVRRKKVAYGSASKRTTKAGTVKLTVKPGRKARKLIGKRVTFTISFAQSGIRKPATSSKTVSTRR